MTRGPLAPTFDAAPFETPRLCLRPWRLDDAPVLRRLLDDNDAHLRPYIPFMRHEPRTLAETATRLRAFEVAGWDGTLLRLAIETRDAEAIVGEVLAFTTDTDVELGYWLAASAVGHGYATEAAEGLVTAIFRFSACRRIRLRCDVENRASNRVAERLGAHRDGVEPAPSVDETSIVNLQVWRLDR